MFWCCVCFYKKILQRKKIPDWTKKSCLDTFDIRVALLVGYLAFLMTILCLYFEKRPTKKNSVWSTSHEVCNFVQTAGDFVLAKICYKGSNSHWELLWRFLRGTSSIWLPYWKPVIIILNWESGQACFALTHIQMWPIFYWILLLGGIAAAVGNSCLWG